LEEDIIIEKTSFNIDKEINNISDTTYSKKIIQLSDIHHTTKIFQELESASPESVCMIEKRAVIKALLLSTWLQRLCFIIRSALMAIFSGIILFLRRRQRRRLLLDIY
jgi:hypothetical protein